MPKASIAVTRNYDFDFVNGQSDDVPYRTSKPVRLLLLISNRHAANLLQVFADAIVHDAVSFSSTMRFGGVQLITSSPSRSSLP